MMIIVPNSVAILGRTYGPGKVRSYVFAAFGALAPIGFIVGGAFAALFAEKADTRWIWWFM